MPKIGHQRSLLLIFTSLLFIYFSTQSSAALAASEPTWQGPYLGISFGGAFASSHTSTNVGQVSDTSYFPTSTDINVVNNAGSLTEDPNSAIVGIQAGHDWVWKHFVYGVVFDYGALPLSSSDKVNGTYADNSASYSISTSMNTNWLSTLRARVGYQIMHPWPSFIYLTGGPAMTQIKVSAYSGRNEQ